MSVFGAYSRYYNLLYRDKNYEAEVDHVHGLIAAHRPGARSVLDLGCGTGRHDLLLAEKGYQVTGVDRSEEMLLVAGKHGARLTGGTPVFQQGDVRTVRLGRTFDVVLSLFHVVSYQTTNADLHAAFATAKAHLAPGGLFIFDCWYGPAVLSTRPETRIKRLEDEDISVVRICESDLLPNVNRVDVNYELFIMDKKSGQVEKLRERHSMRYLFLPEVETLTASNGMQVLFAQEWMTGNAPGTDTWGVCFGLRGHE